MKKAFFILKIFLIVVLSILVLFFVVNFLLFVCINKSLKSENGYMFKRENFSIEKFMNSYDFKEPSGIEYKDKPYNIILFGCSFVQGLGLNDNQTLATKLSEYTKKKVYNRGVGGGGVQHAIIQVQSHKLDSVIKDSKYVIYTLSSISDLDRLYCYPGIYFNTYFLFDKKVYPRYILKNNDLVLYKSKMPYLDGSILGRLIYKFVITQKYHFFNTELIRHAFSVKHFIKLKNEINKINPNTKLIIILYWDTKESFTKFDLEQLNNNNIDIIEISKLVDEEKLHKMRNSYNHPTEDAWNEIVPKLAENIGIN